MRDAETFPYTMNEGWREHWPTAAIVSAALLMVLAVLTWILFQRPQPDHLGTKTIQLFVVPPPLPKPVRETPRPAVEVPAPRPVPPKKLVQARRDSVAATAVSKPKPARPQPRTRSRPVAAPLSLDEPPDWRQAAPPQGANAGYTIGGDGDNGGGSGCGGASVYLSMITSQLRDLFSRSEQLEGHNFRVQAQLGFDDVGGVERSQLLQSTGDADADAVVKKLLKQIDIGEGMPRCIEAITVWVSQPWSGDPLYDDNSPVSPSHVEVWKTPRRP